jgi:pyruvate/2-oxoglutarate dehydrogenase complex dihydrolipoamide acyltransferase (E2) component
MAAFKNFTVKSFPVSRLATIDIGAAAFGKHHVCALVELDVTEARSKMANLEAEGKKVSFNAWLIKCIGETISQNKLIHAMRKGKRKVIIFNDVDLSVIIEREIDGDKIPLPLVVRQVDKKSISEISNEIEGGKVQPIAGEEDYVLHEKKNRSVMKIYYALPGFMRRLIWKELISKPFLVKNNMGTVMVTSVGMVGEFSGWIIPVSVQPVCFAVGSIVRKPAVVNEQIEIRDILHLTVLVDHDVIDGAPAVRALTQLKDKVESGFGL